MSSIKHSRSPRRTGSLIRLPCRDRIHCSVAPTGGRRGIFNQDGGMKRRRLFAIEQFSERTRYVDPMSTPRGSLTAMRA